MKSKLFAIIALVVLLCGTSAQAATILSFQSSPESWVGQGQSFTVTPDDGYLFTYNISIYDNSLVFMIASLNSPFGPDWEPLSGDEYHWWRLYLSAPYDQPLEVGLYNDAVHYALQDGDEPGLEFHGDHRGYDTLYGFFEILEIAFGLDGSIERFAVDFTQYGDEKPEDWITGQFRYNSDIPISNVPVPAGIWLLGSGCAALIGLRKKRQKS